MSDSAFFGFLRCAEFTVINGKDFDPTCNLCLGDLTFHAAHVERLLKSSKTDPFRHGITIQLFKNSDCCKLCPYTALQIYIWRRNNKFSYQRNPSEPLFLAEDGTPLTRSLFIFHVKQMISRLGLNTSHFSGHSFRVGASTSASSARLEDHLIKTWVDGLWTATNLYQDTYTCDTGCPEISSIGIIKSKTLRWYQYMIKLGAIGLRMDFISA